jgi:hypothetical protein
LTGLRSEIPRSQDKFVAAVSLLQNGKMRLSVSYDSGVTIDMFFYGTVIGIYMQYTCTIRYKDITVFLKAVPIISSPALLHRGLISNSPPFKVQNSTES